MRRSAAVRGDGAEARRARRQVPWGLSHWRRRGWRGLVRNNPRPLGMAGSAAWSWREGELSPRISARLEYLGLACTTRLVVQATLKVQPWSVEPLPPARCQISSRMSLGICSSCSTANHDQPSPTCRQLLAASKVLDVFLRARFATRHQMSRAMKRVPKEQPGAEGEPAHGLIPLHCWHLGYSTIRPVAAFSKQSRFLTRERFTVAPCLGRAKSLWSGRRPDQESH